MKKSKPNNDNRLIYVEWEDSVGGSGRWVELSELYPKKMPIQKSVGWLIYETKKWLVIVPHIGLLQKEAPYIGNGEISIPVSSILKRKYINN